MPLITWAYIGFAAGLLVGFSRSYWLICAGVGLLTCVVLSRRSLGVLGVSMLFLAGMMLAESAPAPLPSHRTQQIRVDTATFLGNQRVRAGRLIDTVFRSDAPIARALLVADKTELPQDLKRRYAVAGIAHRLSVSGLHVVLLAAAMDLLLPLLGVPRTAVPPVSLVLVAVYVALLGFPLPALRAGAMFGMSTIARMLQRPTSIWAVLAGCAFIPLIDPSTILTVGYQLNIAGVAGFLAGSALARRVVRPRFTRWRRVVMQLLCISVVATAVTLPLVAWWFGQVSFIAPVTNVVIEPLLAVAQPLLFLGLLFSPILPVAHFLADAVHPLLAAVDGVASYAAALPYASLTIKPGVPAAVLSGVASASVIVACVTRFPARASIVACGAMCAIVWVG